MRDGRGRLVGFSKITRDLTDEKGTTDRLIKEVRQLQAVFDRSHAVMFLKDTSGRYIRVNGQFEKSFGVKADDILGKTDREIFPPIQAKEFEENDRKELAYRPAYYIYSSPVAEHSYSSRIHIGYYTLRVNRYHIRRHMNKLTELIDLPQRPPRLSMCVAPPLVRHDHSSFIDDLNRDADYQLCGRQEVPPGFHSLIHINTVVPERVH